MSSLWYLAAALLMIVIVIETVVDICRYPALRTFRDRHIWWYRRLRVVANTLSLAIAGIGWFVNLISGFATREKRKWVNP